METLPARLERSANTRIRFQILDGSDDTRRRHSTKLVNWTGRYHWLWRQTDADDGWQRESDSNWSHMLSDYWMFWITTKIWHYFIPHALWLLDGLDDNKNLTIFDPTCPLITWWFRWQRKSDGNWSRMPTDYWMVWITTKIWH